MSDLILQVGSNASNDSSDVCILSPASVLSSTSDDSTESASQSQAIHNIPKTIRDKFYVNIKTYDTNWAGQCVLCNKIQYDKKGVTSNMNRHIKTQHDKEYQEWLVQLNEFNNKDQKKISDIFVKNNSTTKSSSSSSSSSCSKSFYNNNHPRQIQLSQSIVKNLIIDLGLPLSIVERQPFIKFMYTVDPKFTLTSRRTLSRTTIPRLYDIMNDELKKFCIGSQFISLSLDIWTDRRLRAFFAMTGITTIFFKRIDSVSNYFLFLGHAFVDNVLKSYVLCFLPLYGSHTANLLLHTYENVVSMFDIQSKLV
jgi:hypothetical protein